MADIKISQLGAAASISDSQITPIVDSGTTVKATMEQIKDYAAGGLSNLDTTDKSSPVAAINEVNAEAKLKKVLFTSVSSFPVTQNDAEITSDMEIASFEVSNPSAYISGTNGGADVTTSNGSVTISGTISGTTNILLRLQRTR